MNEFLYFFKDLITRLFDFLVSIPVVIDGYVTLSYGMILICFIVLGYIASLFWKGAKR